MMTTNIIEDQDVKMLRSVMMISVTGVMAIMIIQQIQQPQVVMAATEADRYGSWWLGPANLILNAELTESAFPLYVGEALPGTLDDEPGWRIYKYEFVIIDDYPEPVKIRYAGGTTDFDKIWDNRAEYEYS